MRLYRHDDPQHLRAFELLPWIATGRVAADELAKVERHVADCIACTQELARLRAWHKAYEREGTDPHASYGFARVQARIDALESSLSDLSRWRRLIAGWRALPLRVRLALTLQAVLVAGLTALFVSQPQTHHYRTQAASVAAHSEGARLVVVFDSARPEHELRALLLTLGARIVDGPSQAGAYTLEVARRSEEHVLVQLRANRAVVGAEKE